MIITCFKFSRTVNLALFSFYSRWSELLLERRRGFEAKSSMILLEKSLCCYVLCNEMLFKRAIRICIGTAIALFWFTSNRDWSYACFLLKRIVWIEQREMVFCTDGTNCNAFRVLFLLSCQVKGQSKDDCAKESIGSGLFRYMVFIQR